MESIVTITGTEQISLADIDTSPTSGLTEQEADSELEALQKELRELHDLMMAAESHAFLVLLQGMDAAGKDVTIENIVTAMNPQAVRVKGFKEPAGDEAKHHFLWRADAALPMYGEAVFFDRSYYEQAIRPQVNGDLSEDVIRMREAHINAFERILTESGTIIVKFFLHVGKDAQQQRLEERQNDIGTAWKVSGSDWSDREHWDDFMAAYDKTLSACATEDNPWHIVPADITSFHNAAVAHLIVKTLRPFREQWEQKRRENGEENRKEADEARIVGAS